MSDDETDIDHQADEKVKGPTLNPTFPHFGACSCDWKVLARSQPSVRESLKAHADYIRADPYRTAAHPFIGAITVHDVPEEPRA